MLLDLRKLFVKRQFSVETANNELEKVRLKISSDIHYKHKILVDDMMKCILSNLSRTKF